MSIVHPRKQIQDVKQDSASLKASKHLDSQFTHLWVLSLLDGTGRTECFILKGLI